MNSVYNSTAQHSTAQHSTAQHSTFLSSDNKKLKVLYILSWYDNYNLHGTPFGGEGFFSEPARALQKYCDVAIYSPFDFSIEKSFNYENEFGILTFRSRVKRGNSKNNINRILRLIRNFFSFFRGYVRLQKSFKPDIIHAHAASYAGFFAVLLSKITHIPVIVTEHQTTEAMSLQNQISKSGYYYTYKNASLAVCVSMSQYKRFCTIFKDVNFVVIYNGISDRLKDIDKTTKKYRRENYINCDIVAGLYSDSVKGLQYLLPAMKILAHDLNLPIMLHIIGGGKFLDYHKNMVSELEITNNCIFYGQCPRDEVYSIISEMDFGISASLFESAGVSVEETMMMGKPLVVTKSGGADSLVTDYTAIVVDKGSTEALVEGIKEMAERYKEFDSARIREYALNNFEIDHITRKYLELYCECLKK